MEGRMAEGENTAHGYIALKRRFAEYRGSEDIEHGDWSVFYGSDLYARHTWPDLLKHRCTVVIGASGSGKSMEFKEQTYSLRSAGKAAFFCRLEDLANLPLHSALEIGIPSELDTWLAG